MERCQLPCLGVWQNSIRKLMEMEPIASAYTTRVALIAIATGVALVCAGRLLCLCWGFVHRKVNRVVPRRVSYVVSTLLVAAAIVLVTNHVVARLALNAADRVFLQLDQIIDEGVEQPAVQALELPNPGLDKGGGVHGRAVPCEQRPRRAIPGAGPVE